MDDRLITLAIHTYEKATILRSILEAEGIPVALQNVNLVQPVVSSGVRVRIHESDLPKALRIIESSEVFSAEAPAAAAAHKAPVVLVPVDFSDHSYRACVIAFAFAASCGARIVVMHSFIAPSMGPAIQITASLDFSDDFDSFDEMEDEAETRLSIEEASEKQLKAFAERLRREIRDGSLAAAEFTTRLVEDDAEDAINAVAKELSPIAIVMGTRGAGRKEAEMIGSVTAEVLDTCRFPVVTVPDGAEPLPYLTDADAEAARSSHVVFFCNYDQRDLIALDTLYRLFPTAGFRVNLISIPAHSSSHLDPAFAADGLKKYCAEHFPRFSFDVRTSGLTDMEAIFDDIRADRHIDLIAIPNKKRNIFSRLFNPGLAHRLLFHFDIPLVVLPV